MASTVLSLGLPVPSLSRGSSLGACAVAGAFSGVWEDLMLIQKSISSTSMEVAL